MANPMHQLCFCLFAILSASIFYHRQVSAHVASPEPTEILEERMEILDMTTVPAVAEITRSHAERVGTFFTQASKLPRGRTCELSFDFSFLLDNTEGMEDVISIMYDRLPYMFQRLLKRHPQSRFSLATFNDKPFAPLGDERDYCVRLENIPGGYGWSGVEEFTDAFRRVVNETLLKPGGFRRGGDAREDHLTAILQAGNQYFQWYRLPPQYPRSRESDLPWRGEMDSRVLVVITDSMPHEYPDFDQLTKGHPWRENITITQQEAACRNYTAVEDVCLKRDYPTPAQIAECLVPWHYQGVNRVSDNNLAVDGRVYYIVVLLAETSTNGGDLEEIEKYWHGFMDAVGQPHVAVGRFSWRFEENLVRILDEYALRRCTLYRGVRDATHACVSQ